MFSRRSVLAAVAATPWFAPGVPRAETPAEPPTIDELLRKPKVLDAALSPNGKRVALLHEQQVEGKRVAALILSGDAEKPVVVGIGDYDVEQVEWANDERLLIWMMFDKTSEGEPTGLWFGGVFVPIPVRRVVVVSADGKDTVGLFGNQTSTLKRTFDLGNVVDTLADDPRHVLMQAWDQKRSSYALHRVDVYTGEATVVERGVQATDFWFTQRGTPVLRFDSNPRGTVATLYGRAPGERDWKLVRKIRRNESQRFDEFDVVGFAEEPGVLLVSSVVEGEDVRTIRRFDLTTLEYGEVVARQPGRDLIDAFTDEQGRLVACAYVDDRVGYAFADPVLAPHFKAINRYLKDECNVRLFDVNADRTRFLLKVSGPRHPGAFYLYDTAVREMELVGERYPWLTPERLARQEVLAVRTRDGAEVTAYLTVPSGPEKPRPMVVMPHGGPETRDTYDFDLWAQALAAQGWLVLQPNFRGSDGYGKAFADAGRGRWGDRMQEDVEDCVAHVLASGRADPARLAIMGASYGGYAALMGVVRQPALYRAAVSIAGPCDLIRQLAFTRREEGGDSLVYAYWLKTIGDPKADADRLKAASPRLRAAEIQAPVLLIHGAEDDVVPADASRDMAKALEAAGKAHDHVELKGVGHRGWNTAAHKTILGKAVAFLSKALTA